MDTATAVTIIFLNIDQLILKKTANNAKLEHSSKCLLDAHSQDLLNTVFTTQDCSRDLDCLHFLANYAKRFVYLRAYVELVFQ